jgi:hypothetical protein
MSQGLAFRLDLVDWAVEGGWEVESTRSTDQFERDGVAVLVQYSRDDDITTIVRSRQGREDETYGLESAGKDERLKIWLGIRGKAGGQSGGQLKVPAHLIPKPGDWTRDEFVAAVEDSSDRVFLAALLELVDANSELPSQGMPIRLAFGTRPGGHMFVYPLGRRFPPFKFKVKDGRLLISGCWSEFDIVKGHKGFAEIASMLDLDETGTASSISVAGLEAKEVWEVGERVSKAVNG